MTFGNGNKNAYFFAGIGKFDGIGDQVAEDALQRHGVGGDHRQRGLGKRGGQGLFFGDCAGAQEFHDAFQEVVEVDRYFDVDRPEDLELLAERLRLGEARAPVTARLVDELMGGGRAPAS